jgi:hypothetical protein
MVTVIGWEATMGMGTPSKVPVSSCHAPSRLLAEATHAVITNATKVIRAILLIPL